MNALLVAVVITALFTTGCVSVNDPANWRPYDTALNAKYYGCFRDAQQGYSRSRAGIAFSQSGGGGSATSSSGVKTNYDMLKSCMQAQGYQKRDATTTETVLGWTLSPVWVPLCIVGLVGGINCFENL
jgi:hypothetical protein